MTAPDFDDLPDTGDLKPPTSDEIPLQVLANTLAIRSVRRDILGAKTWFRRMAIAFVSGGITIAGAVVGVAMERGAEQERDRQQSVEIDRNSERISRLEQKAMGGTDR